MRKIVGIALLLGLMGSRVVAQAPTSGNVFVGYSFENANSSALNQSLGRFNLQGWEAAVGKVFGPVRIVADFSGHYGSLSNDVLPPEGPGPIPGPVIVDLHRPRRRLSVRTALLPAGWPVSDFRGI